MKATPFILGLLTVGVGALGLTVTLMYERHKKLVREQQVYNPMAYTKPSEKNKRNTVFP